MKMGQHTERGRFVFTAGKSLSDKPPKRVVSPSSILALTLLAQQSSAAQEFVLSSGETFECPSKEHQLTLAIRALFA